jgi:hypothetical protein
MYLQKRNKQKNLDKNLSFFHIKGQTKKSPRITGNWGTISISNAEARYFRLYRTFHSESVVSEAAALLLSRGDCELKMKGIERDWVTSWIDLWPNKRHGWFLKFCKGS